MSLPPRLSPKRKANPPRSNRAFQCLRAEKHRAFCRRGVFNVVAIGQRMNASIAPLGVVLISFQNGTFAPARTIIHMQTNKFGACNGRDHVNTLGGLIKVVGWIVFAVTAFWSFFLCLGIIKTAAGFWGAFAALILGPVAFVAAPLYAVCSGRLVSACAWLRWRYCDSSPIWHR